MFSDSTEEPQANKSEPYPEPQANTSEPLETQNVNIPSSGPKKTKVAMKSTIPTQPGKNVYFLVAIPLFMLVVT